MVVGDKVKFRYGTVSDYVYRGTVEEIVPKGVHPITLGFRVPQEETRDHESYLCRSGSIVFWPNNKDLL